ncbi:hemagglutinin repeat-containing protein [Orbus wheelerorum]|uniref:two-partner secretion domain-containing protein n=1 Tax=Orbus wheelerorum TaxID=3074111 RepID=UPI00370D2443
MNKHFYRIIFNQARGMLMVVGEIVKRHQGEGRSSQQATETKINDNTITAALKPIRFLTYVALGFVSVNAASYANTIIVDNNADKSQRPTVNQTANGATQINIQEASKAGVSHNKFSQFDVSQKGVILNNSAQLSNTELAGYIKGNDNLIRSGSAKVILNEINAKNASQLNGYIEVAGQKAQVIIANAAGITCNGCGFINADRATLTTGKPVFENGQLKGYLVEQGNITINGKGMDSSRQNYTDLIARTVNINSSLWANDVTVIAGKNKVSHDLQTIEALDSLDDKPQVAIDVAALGGMYAGGIKLIGTEGGVGVYNAGSLGASAGNLTISADGKIVNTGAMQAKQDITLNSSQNIDNQNKINAKANINLKTKTTLNNEGTVVAQNNLTINADNLNNQANATIAAGIDENGKLTQAGNLTIKANQASLKGQQLATNVISINTASNLDLAGSQNRAGQLLIESGSLNTQNAAFAIDGDGTLTTRNWYNQQSSMQVNGAFSASADHIINTDAILYADKLDINATSLSGDGKLLADSSLNLTLKNDFINRNQLLSNGDLSIYSDNAIENEGQLTSGKTLSITGNDIINKDTGEIESASVNVTGVNLTNQGLVNGNLVTSHLTGELNNENSGRIYGDQITLNAQTLNNRALAAISPVIAARNQLTVNVTTLNNLNHASLLSLGDLRIDAATVNNHSSKIESADNMVLNVETLNNINDKIETQEVLIDSQDVLEYSPIGSSVHYNADVVKAYRTSSNHNYLTLESLAGEFAKTYQFYKYSYRANTYETQITETNPGEILAGKNLTIMGNNVKNDNSQIIAGNELTISAANIENISLKGEHRVENIGTTTYYDRKKRTKVPGQSRKWKQSSSNSAYNQIVKNEIDVGNGKIDEHTVIQTPTADIKDLTNANVSSNVVGLVEPNTALPNNSIYTINKGVDKNYLIETDSRFTNKKEWLSSDYMFKQLKADPNNIQKRLGDGYYEQQLIKEQIVTLTGQRHLGDYADDMTQYKALMNAGAEFAQRYGLSIGFALTAEQMNALTNDIVWMVSKTVNINGENIDVLVPQVYVVNRPQVTTSGALIAGKGVSIESRGDLSSSGSVVSKDSLNILANNVSNRGVIMGDSLDIKAVNSITSNGALMAENGISLAANNNINLISTTKTTETTYGQNSTANTVINHVSSVQTKNGDITINAGQDVNLGAALVVNQSKDGKTAISAGNDINLSTVTTNTQENTVWGGNNYRKIDKDEVVGSEIRGKGDVTLSAGNDITVKAGNVSSDSSLSLSAGNTIAITGDSQHEQLTDHQKVKSSGMLSKSSVTTHIDVDNLTQKGSSLSGDTVNINAGNHLVVTGSQVVGSKNVNLTANNDVTIDAAEESYYNHQQTIKQKSGLMSGGNLGFAIGKEKDDLKQTDRTQGYQASTVGSTEGNVTINAGKDLSVKGSDIIAKKDITLTGDNVTLESNDSKVTYKEEYKYEKTGLTLAITGTAADVYDAAKAVEQAKKNDNDKLLALQSIKAALTAVQAAQDLQLKNEKGDTQASIGVSATFGTQKTEREINQEQHNVVGSGVSAGDNITIKAVGDVQGNGGDITVKGSEVKAGQDITLEAGHDVNVIGAVNTQHSDKDEKSYGGGVGISFTVGGDQTGLRFTGNANFSRERENADGSAWSEGIVEAGKNLMVKTGNDATLIGAQLKGDGVKMDVGHNLNIASLQDTDNYDYEKITASVNGSFGTGFSGNLALSQTKMDSNWASVTDQSGIFAGKNGFDVTVGNNTDLKGAVIASTAEDKSNNKLDTGTISFSDIENKADFDVSHVSISIGTSGASPTAGMPSIYHNSDSASSTTKSAVEDGTLIVRNQDEQKQNVDELSRNTENANNPLGQIFDKQKEQDKMDALDLVRDIAAQTKDVVNKYDRIQAQNDLAKDKDGIINNAKDTYDKLTDSDKKALAEKGINSADDYANNSYYVAVNDKVIDNKKNNLGGMGSTVSKGIDAATAIVSGLITGDFTGGLAGASAPYIAGIIKEQTYERDDKGNIRYDDKGDPKVNTEANLIAHAILGAAVAAAQGNSALAGGIGAVTGEAAADFIYKTLYGDTPKDKLTQEQKENISALAQLASGLAVAAGSGGNIGDVGTAVAGSKNAVENNLLSSQKGTEKLDKESKELYEKIKDVVGYDEIDQLQKQYMNCQSDECRTAIYNDYYQKEQEAGQKLVDLYKSGQLTKADFEQLVTWYNDSMLDGVEQAKADAGGNRKLWDIYDASSMDMTPAGLIGNPYLAEIRGLILLDQWRSEGLSESQIQEKFLKDGVLGAFGSAPDVNAIVHQIRNDGLSLEDGLKFATLAAFGKVTSDASQGKVSQTTVKGTSNNVVKADTVTQADAKNYFGQQRQYWSNDPVQFKGNKVYQRNDLFDINFVDAKGRTNLERMQKGLAPIGKDGQSVNLHHMTQKQDGPIAEVTQNFHKDNHSVIHVNDNSIPSGIDRNQFNKWRSEYWKNRADEFKK